MENKKPTQKIESKIELTKAESASLDVPEPKHHENKDDKVIGKSGSGSSLKKNSDNSDKLKSESDLNVSSPKIPKKPVKPPKIEDKPFKEFIDDCLMPGLRSSIEERGTSVKDIKLMEGERPVVGGRCWMVFCEISEQRRFWLCFNKEIITSDKTILLAESNCEPSIVESFLIDEKKTTLALLISRVLQRLNGQKWLGIN